MVSLNLKSLIGTLNTTCTRTLEAAAGLCLSRSNYNVEVEHWLLKLLEDSRSDLSVILTAFSVDSSRVIADLTRAVDRLKTGNASSPLLSEQLVDLVREAWVIASVEHGASKTRSGHLLAALLGDRSLKQIVQQRLSPDLLKISFEKLSEGLETIAAGTAEAESAPSNEFPAAGGALRPAASGNTPSLDQYTIDLTARARDGKIDPILGRDQEIRQVIDILIRRRQNNPILTGEAGVGKTAVVEGFAVRIVNGDVPPALQNVSLRTLDLGLLQAGAGVKGEFENRLKSVIEEVNRSVTPIILFIDEAHTLIGAGGQAGQGDAANLLKPALARGELRTIAATTWAEYKKYFERDAALARRFQVVKVEEPTEETAIAMMRGLVGILQQHHGIEILNEAVVDSVKLSSRYISGRQLPDKSVSLLDTACARVAIGHTAAPAAVEDCQRFIDQTSTAIEVLEREIAAGGNHTEQLSELRQKKAEAFERYYKLRDQWQQEKTLTTRIRDLRKSLSSEVGTVDTSATAQQSNHESATQSASQPLDRDGLLQELRELQAQLKRIQGEQPLLQFCVDSQAIAEIVSSWTGIPVGRMMSDEINTILTLQNRLEEKVVGQSHALDAIAKTIKTSRANLTDPSRPIGVFFLVGPSGVGKTETAIALAELLYGGEQNMTVINMSEFKEEHKVSLLMGSPPGYVGYGEGGVLTEAVRRKPYSVVLLDEMEKAHPGVQDIFYQVFDKGNMKDGEGRDIDFRNTVILMTSNAATDTIKALCADPELLPTPESLASALHPELLKTFKPAFLGRTSVVPYFPLDDSIMRQITLLKLGKVARRIRQNYNAPFAWSEAVVDHIVSRCTEVDSGARNVDKILNGTLLPQMSAEFLGRMAAGSTVTRANVDLNEEGQFVFDVA